MHKEGFWYISYVKGLHYDGHDHPDVVEYCQNHFLSMLKELEPWLVRYETKEIIIEQPNHVKCWLVLSPNDETTSRANEGHDKSWVYMNEFPLQKKGQGHSLHEIYGMVGYLHKGRQM